jgi:hypothetical protein
MSLDSAKWSCYDRACDRELDASFVLWGQSYSIADVEGHKYLDYAHEGGCYYWSHGSALHRSHAHNSASEVLQILSFLPSFVDSCTDNPI